jgi:predicted nucleic acid-binding protein
LIAGCRVEALTERQARAAGTLAASSSMRDTVDLAVAEGALRRGNTVVTANRRHIEQAASGVGRRLAILDI